MKRFITAAFLCFVMMGIEQKVHAQWQGTNPVYYNVGKVGIGTDVPSFDVDILKELPYLRLHSTSYTNNPSQVTKKGGIIFGQNAGDKTAAITGAVPPGYHVPGILFSTKTSWSMPGPGTTQWYDRMYIHPSGNVGINELNPSDKLQVNGTIGGNTSYNTPMNANGSDAANYANNYSLKLINSNNGLYVSIAGTFNARKVYLQSGHSDPAYAYGTGSIVLNPFGGNVGIGTANVDPDAKLAVKGQIHAQEVKVDLTGAMVPDYVFESGYKLMELDELDSFIKKNKHLPEVPGASEMEAHGMQLGEMNLLLLKKVEELTLHLIRQEKELSVLKSTLNKFEAFKK